MSAPYELSIQEIDGVRRVHFANNSDQFVEVVVVVGGREVREGCVPSTKTRGFGYPPKLEKFIRKRKDGTPIDLPSSGGVVRAMVYPGNGSYLECDLEKPTFLRHKMVSKMHFRRTSNEPVMILEKRF